MNKKTLRLGGGAGYSGDRIEPAVDLARRGNLDYLIFECLAERTIALAQQRKAHNPNLGYDPLLEERFRHCLPVCVRNGIRIITNMGAANPLAAMQKTLEVANELGLHGVKIAAITGDNVLDWLKEEDSYNLLETGEPITSIRDRMVSANAYLGAAPMVEALRKGADIVITGRVADPALFSAPMIFEFGWDMQQYELLGKAILLGHLMECAGHVTGGYFADPGYKDVPNLDNLGFPIAEVDIEGEFFITKLADTGGQVTEATCKEQLLYEIHDPSRYLTPDVIADFSQVNVHEIGKDIVKVSGARGLPKSGQLKVSIGYHDGFIGEGQIGYGGPGAESRARLAGEVVKSRLQRYSGIQELQIDLIGINALYGTSRDSQTPFEVRLRVAGRSSERKLAERIGREVEALYTNGPAAGGGVVKSIREVTAVQSVLVDETMVTPVKHYETI